MSETIVIKHELGPFKSDDEDLLCVPGNKGRYRHPEVYFSIKKKM